MVESACLFRSFSTPAESSGAASEGNPMRMLGESISFGRFLSENLDWEKWSAFSHNRYVEEAEKYSKPGSVAAKKAYFEAHYRRKAAALVEEPNAQVGGNFDSETCKANHANSAVTTESEADGIVTANVQPDKDAAVSQIVDCADVNQPKHDVGQSDIDISDAEGVIEPHPCTDESLNVESCDSNQFDHVEPHKTINLPGVENMTDPGAVVQEVLPSPKLSTKIRAAKLLHSLNERKAAAALPPRSGISKKSVRVSGEDKRSTSRPLRLSINLPSGTVETRKTAAGAAQSKSVINSVSNSKKRVEGLIEKKCVSARPLYMSVNVNLPSGARETRKLATSASVKPRNVINHESKSMKSIGDSVKKKPTTRSLHMSINLSSDSDETSKMGSVLEHNRMEKNHSNVPTISKDHPMASQTSNKASRGFLNQASENSLSERRRSERLLYKSMSGGVTANAKLSSISADCSRSNPRPPTTSLPFRFRSEERAIKRRERIEEVKSKEAEAVQLQRTSKDKMEHDHKKLRQSSVFKSKLIEERNGRPHSPSNQIRKTSLTQLESPKCVRKVNSGTVPDKNLPKLRKPPINTNNSKRITEKVNRTTRESGTSSNITRENDSPNILKVVEA